MRLNSLIILLLTLAGFALRLLYMTSTHPFFDEYTTVLAARQILQYGWPRLPSGLFYEHGLLATYLIAPFTALFINSPIAQWQPAHWGLMLSRWPSVLLGTVTIPLIYRVGCCLNANTFQISPPSSPQGGHEAWRKIPPATLTPYQPALAFLAAGFFAFSPEGMVWGGRARMYALATLLVLVTVYWAYRGAVYPAPAKYRWYALLTLLATLLTQFGALMLVPPLLVAMLMVGWLSHNWSAKVKLWHNWRGNVKLCPSNPRPWFLQPKTIISEGAALLLIIGLSILVKRLGQPSGMASLAATDGQNLLDALLNTVTYQTAFHFTWAETTTFLARQFGVPHHFWLTVIMLSGTFIGLLFWLTRKQLPITNAPSLQLFPLFLWLIFGFILLEMITLLEPFRRNPRYMVMYLPLFYLITAQAVFNFRFLLVLLSRPTPYALRPTPYTLIALSLLFFFTSLGFNDLRIALLTPEPAYEEAFAYVQAEWRAGDALLTMNTPAAALYLGRVDGFTVQVEADQFLLNPTQNPVDRWGGVPWLGQTTAFNTALNEHKRVWFVSDTIRQPVYFRGDWLALVNHQMEQVWAHDNALVYRTRADRSPWPTHPEILVKATLGAAVKLVGYTLQSPITTRSNQSPITLHLTLFWQALTPLPTDYTVFLHLRNSEGVTVAQRDGLPLEGAYPTSHWQPGETIIDPINFLLPADLPPGDYQFLGGLYQLDTLERLPVKHDTSGENAILLGEITLP